MFYIYWYQINFLLIYFISLNVLFHVLCLLPRRSTYLSCLARARHRFALQLFLTSLIWNFAGIPPFINFFFKLFLFSLFTKINILVYAILLFNIFFLPLFFYTRCLRFLFAQKTNTGYTHYLSSYFGSIFVSSALILWFLMPFFFSDIFQQCFS